jgi:hypothetical protein
MTLTVQDAKTNKPCVLSTLSLTFFDLHAGKHGMQGDFITVDKFTDYSLDEETSVKVQKHADGSATFRGVAHGTGDDNPVDPMYTGPQQRKRAVSLTYKNTSNIGCVLTAGRESSRFVFVPLPSLDCTAQPRGDFRGHLRDLDWKPPLEVPVVAGRQEQFLRWLVQQGDNVDAGDELCHVRFSNGTNGFHKAPFGGTVRLLQSELEAEDEIDVRLSERTLAVISRARLPPLNASASGNDSTTVFQLKAGQVFVRWRSKLNSSMHPGSVVAEIQDMKGKHSKVHSNSSGILLARQEELREGDPMDLLSGGSLAVIGKMLPLDVERGEAPTLADPGLLFVAWTRSVNVFVEKGAEIATLKKT